jgi:hypothetical protein
MGAVVAGSALQTAHRTASTYTNTRPQARIPLPQHKSLSSSSPTSYPVSSNRARLIVTPCTAPYPGSGARFRAKSTDVILRWARQSLSLRSIASGVIKAMMGN